MRSSMLLASVRAASTFLRLPKVAGAGTDLEVLHGFVVEAYDDGLKLLVGVAELVVVIGRPPQHDYIFIALLRSELATLWIQPVGDFLPTQSIRKAILIFRIIS